MTNRPVFLAAAGLGFVGVALGAFGAHGLKPFLAETGRAAIWDTAVFYLFVHTSALAFLPWLSRGRIWPFSCFIAGILLFSGSLFLYALGGPPWLAAMTPVGGFCFLVGWVTLGVAAVHSG